MALSNGGKKKQSAQTASEQAEHDHHLVEAGEGRHIEAEGAGTDQAQRDQPARLEAIGERAACHKQGGCHDRVDAEQSPDLGMRQAHVLLHRDGPAPEDEDQEAKPFGLGRCRHVSMWQWQ